MRGLTTLFLLAGLALAVGTAAAENPARYDVEVLVFEIHSPHLEGGELWTRLEEPINTSETVSVDDMPASEAFAEAAEKLSADEHFRVLLQKRWIQTGEPEAEVPPVLINTWNQELNGYIRFYVSRFMHVVLNLAFQPASTDVIGGVAAGPTYTIHTERRIRENQINYFDHPKFGVLVRVSPVEGS